MHDNARCGHVLKVELLYRSNSHFFIFGMVSYGNEVGRSGTEVLWGHLQPSSSGAAQPLLIDLTYISRVGGFYDFRRVTTYCGEVSIDNEQVHHSII